MAPCQQPHKAALLILLSMLLCGFMGAEEDLFTPLTPIDSSGGWELQCWSLLVSGAFGECLAKACGCPVIFPVDVILNYTIGG